MQEVTADQNLVGVFDSGVGGLSVLRVMQETLPAQPLLFFGDQAHVPYGVRAREEVLDFSTEITRFLLAHGTKLIVVACNTASSASLKSLREQFPDTPFVGMEPAVKPAAEQTHSGVVGILATYATFQSDVYASVVERFASGVKVLQNHCPGLVPEIEKGNLNGAETRRILTDAIAPMLREGVDTIVMGCTHYPFVIPLIQEIAGPNVRVIDPAPAIARQVQRVLDSYGWLNMNGKQASTRYFTSGDRSGFEKIVHQFLGKNIHSQQASWKDGKLIF